MLEKTADDAVTVEKEMGVSHREFFRVLPGALEADNFHIEGNRVIVAQGDRRLVVTLAPETQRRIALLTLPVTRVRLTFAGYGDDEVNRALTRFDRAFQRGGG